MVIAEMKIPLEGIVEVITVFWVEDVEDVVGDVETVELFLETNEKMVPDDPVEAFKGGDGHEWPVSGAFFWPFEDFNALFLKWPLLVALVVVVFKDESLSIKNAKWIDDELKKCACSKMAGQKLGAEEINCK